MTRPLRTLHRYTWALLSLALPALLILSVAFRPTPAKNIDKELDQAFSYRIKETEKMAYSVTINVKQALPTASYLIYARSGKETWMLGRIGGRGMYLFNSPRVFDQVFVYDAIHRVEISGIKVEK